LRLSNFPVWIFDVEDRDPVRPTFGFRLIDGKGVGGRLARIIIDGLGWAVGSLTQVGARRGSSSPSGAPRTTSTATAAGSTGDPPRQPEV
jgi:hypothetical protein